MPIPEAGAITILWSNVPPEHEEAIRKWHNLEHTTERLEGTGYIALHRYNREGGRVSVRLVDTGKRVRLVVEDEGIGIDDNEQGLIFDEFYRSNAARETSSLGTGLGLPIVRKFVEELGGTIEVDSRVDRGSTFTVTLPRKSRKRRK